MTNGTAIVPAIVIEGTREDWPRRAGVHQAGEQGSCAGTSGAHRRETAGIVRPPPNGVRWGTSARRGSE